MRPTHGRRWLTAVGAAVITAVTVPVAAYAGIHLAQVHQQYWQWRWTPTPAPPKIAFEGRNYSRAAAVTSAPSGDVAMGTTAAGQSTIYGPPQGRYAPTSLEVRTPEGRWVGYVLMGGP